MDSGERWPLGESRMRGVLCGPFMQWLRDAIGSDELDRRVQEVVASSGRWQLRIDSEGLNFLPSRWYPASLVHAVVDAAFEGTSPTKKLSIAGNAGRFTYRRQLTGFQRAIFSMFLTPERFARHAPRAWRHNFATGEISFETSGHSQVTRYAQWQEHHPLICHALKLGRLELYAAMKLDSPRLQLGSCDPAHGCWSQVYWGEACEGDPSHFDAYASDPLES